MIITNYNPPLPVRHVTTSVVEIEEDFWRELQSLEVMQSQELAEIEAESMGWIELATRAYLHTGNEELPIIDIVGIATASMTANNVLWLL